MGPGMGGQAGRGLKTHVIVCNKADLVPADVRQKWARYFRSLGWLGYEDVAGRGKAFVAGGANACKRVEGGEEEISRGDGVWEGGDARDSTRREQGEVNRTFFFFFSAAQELAQQKEEMALYEATQGAEREQAKGQERERAQADARSEGEVNAGGGEGRGFKGVGWLDVKRAQKIEAFLQKRAAAGLGEGEKWRESGVCVGGQWGGDGLGGKKVPGAELPWKEEGEGMEREREKEVMERGSTGGNAGVLNADEMLDVLLKVGGKHAWMERRSGADHDLNRERRRRRRRRRRKEEERREEGGEEAGDHGEGERGRSRSFSGRGDEGEGEAASTDELVSIGFIGFPNVGKSSLVNALCCGRTATAIRVAQSAAPGKTKHLQSIMIESAAGQYDREEEESWVEEEERQSEERHSSFRQGASRACIIDCPGLVLPSLVSSRAEMICGGVLSIHTLRDSVTPLELVCQTVPVSVLESVYTIRVARARKRISCQGALGWGTSRPFIATTRPYIAGRGSGTTSALDIMRNARMKLLAGAVKGEASSSSLAHADAGVHTQKGLDSCTANDLLDAFCRARGLAQQNSGQPDYNRGARIILGDYLAGRLPHWALPPS